MAEPYAYRREDVTDADGNVIDTAVFRIRRGSDSGNGGGVAVNPWENAEYRGSRGGRLSRYIQTAAGRGAARNPVMRNNRYGF